MKSVLGLLIKILFTVSFAMIGLSGCKQGADSVDQFLDGIGTGTDPEVTPADPTLDLDPATHDFGPLLTTAGSPLSQTVTVTNLNDEILYVDSITAPASADFTLVSETCTAIVAGLNKNDQCSFVVDFQPATSGNKNFIVTTTFGETPGDTSLNVNMNFTGLGAVPANLAVSDGPTFDYGAVVVTATAEKTFNVTNSGDVPATTVVGTGLAAPFAFKGGSYPGTGGTCTATINAGVTCTMVVTYNPGSTGAANDTITLNYHNGDSATSTTRDIQGTGSTAASLGLSDGPTFNYGTFAIGATSDKTFTLTNSGGVTATGLAGAGLAAPYTFKGGVFPGTGGNCATTLAGGGGNCTIVVTFTPTAAAVANDTVEVNYFDGLASQTASRPVTATGANPAVLAVNGGATYDFGTVTIGDTAEVTLTVDNTGGFTASSLTGTGLASPFTFKGGSYPGTGGTCGSSLNASNNCTVVIVYTPTISGTQNDTLSMDYNNGASAQSSTRPLQGTAVAPANLSINQGPTYNFGTLPVGGTADVTLTVNNSGGVNATTVVGGGLAAPYTYKGGSYPGTGGDCTATINASTSCTIVVTYSPTGTGTNNDTVDLSYNNGLVGTNATRALTGNAVTAASLALDNGPTFDFGSEPIGKTVEATLTLTNSGGFTASSVSGSGLAAPFTFKGGAFPGTGGTCSSSLGGSSACTIVVTFTPSGLGLAADQIDINYNDGVAGQSTNRPIQGTGVNPGLIDISDGPTYDFGSVAVSGSAEHTFVLTNNGQYGVTAMGGSGLAAPFTYKGGSFPGTGGNCGTTLAPTVSCNVVVVYSPTGLGANNDTIDISYNNGVSAQNATRDVQGLGANPATLSISDGPTYNFGSQPNGVSVDYTFTVSNTGGVTATSMAGAGLAAPYTYKGGSYPGTGGTCSTDLNATNNCTIVVTYNPSTVATHNDTIEVNYNDSLAAQTATRAVTGTAVNPGNLTISDGPTATFTTIAAGGTAEKTLTVQNTGDYTASAMSGSGLAAPYTFKGGSYPGTGGTCNTTLTASSSCTVIIVYSPVGTGTHNDTLDIDYNDGVNAQTSSRPITGTAASPASLALSDGPTYNYGSLAVGGSLDQTFTLTNSGGVSATGLSGSGLAAPYSYKGGSFPGTGGTCLTVLAGSSATCTVVVTYAPTGTGTHNDTIEISYNNGVIAQSANRDLTATGVDAATIDISDGPVFSFGTVAATATVEKSFTLTNNGDVNATSIGGSGLAAPFAFKGGSFPGTGGNCAGTLAPAGNCTIVVTFNPPSNNTYSDTIDISFNNSVSVVNSTRDIQGIAAAPGLLTIDGGPTYNFGSFANGSINEHTFTVNNGGGVDATSMSGSGLASPFTFKGGSYPGTGGTCSTTLTPSNSCTIVVEFSPSTVNTFGDTIDIAYNNGLSAQNALRAVSGTSVAPGLIDISDGATFDFGSVAVGGSVDKTFTLTNNGNFVVSSMTGAGLAAPFSFKGGSFPGTGGNCTATLNPTLSCTIVVTYSPGSSGLLGDTVEIDYYNGATNVQSTRPIQGTGTTPALITLSDGPTFDYTSHASGSNTDKTFTVTNGGGVTATSISGSGLAAPFSFKGGSYPGSGGTCGTTLGASNNCTIVVTYSPGALGTDNDTISIDYFNGAASDSGTRAVTGQSVAPASLTMTDGPTYNYGTYATGASIDKTITISNGGAVSATSIAGSGLVAPFSFKGGSYPGTGGTCSTSLAASNNCTIIVTFNPGSTGAFNDTIDIDYHNGAANQTSQRDLSGTGANPASLTISDGATYDYGTQATTSSTDKTFTVTNGGGVPATSVAGTGLASPYTFKGGSFPGTGGTCTATINASDNCTIVVTYTPTATGSQGDTIDVNYNDGVTGQTAQRPVTGTGAAPASLTISDGATYNYGSIAAGGTADKTFTVTNGGGVPATSVSGSGLAAPYGFKGGSFPGTGGTCTSTLNDSDNCTIVVTYAPSGAGTHPDTINVDYNDGVAAQTANRAVTGTAVAPATITISDGATYNYGPIPNTGSVDKVFTLNNTGNVNATSVTGTGLAAPYSFKGGSFPGTGGSCSGTLNALDNCTIVVTFNPTATGSYPDTIDVNYFDGASAQTSQRDVTGSGALPASLTISDGATFNYGSVANNSTNDKTFTVTNGGGVQATSMAGAGLAAPYTFKGGSYPGTGGTCSTDLNASDNCTVVVTFNPTSTGSPGDTLEVNFNDGLTGQTASRPFTGTSVNPASITISDGASYDYGTIATNSSADKTFTLTNGGDVTATSVSGTGLAAPFQFKGGSFPGTGGNCTATLNSSANCTIVVTYNPTATGTLGDTIEIDYDNGATSVQSTRPVQGTGAAPATLAISDGATFNYGTVANGSSNDKTFTVSNSGGVQATSISGTGIAAPYTFKGGSFPGTGGNCTASLNASDNCTIVVTYNPSTIATHNDTIEIDYNDGVAAQQATRAVTGVAVAPANLTISDGPTFNYGTRATGSTLDKTFTVTNGGGVQATSITGGGLAAPFTYKGGSYPGTGGTCSTSLNNSDNCTIVVTYDPTTVAGHADTIEIDYDNGATTVQSTRAVAGTGANPASITISDGATYDFGGVPQGANREYTFTLTNGGGVAASSMAGAGITAPYTFKGGSYPGTGGTCTTDLNASDNCTIVVAYDPASQAVHNDTIDVNYNDGAAAQTAQRAVTGTGLAPASLSISESPTYDYGTVATGSSTDKSFIVSNTGGYNASSMAGTGLAAPYSFKGGSYPGTGGTCTTDLADSANCTIIVTYNPSGAATHNDTIQVTYNDGVTGQTADRAVTGNAAAPASITISDGATFDYTTVANGSSNDKTFTVTNGGGVPATSLGAGGLAPPYSFKDGTYPGTGGTCSTSLNASDNCTIVVTFAPASSNTYGDTLQVTYNDGAAGQTSDRPVTGTSVAPANLSISDGVTYDYGTVANTASVDKIFTITNGGGFNASSMSGTGLAAPYSFKGGSYPGTGGTCNTDLGSSANCTIVVTYNPTATGSHPDTIQIDYNNGAISTNTTRNVAGAGAPAASLTISDGATFDFGTVASSTTNEKTFTITNAGGVPATSMAGSGLAAPYSFKGGSYPGTGGTCTTSLVATDNCTVVVTYAPITNVVHNDTMDITFDNGIAGGQTSSRPLTGTAQAPAVLTISDGGTFDFGTLANGATAEKTFTITNSGTFQASSITGSGLVSPYSFKGGGYPGTGGSCTTTLAGGGGNCTIVVVFAPGSSATHNDTIEIDYYDGAAARQSDRAVTGISASPAVLTISEGPLYDYGTVANSTTKDRTFTVSNSGGVDATSLAGAGLAAPFDFKGGTFPGTGGTCNTGTVAASGSCTIVVTYSPGASVTSNDTIELTYNDGIAAQGSNRNIRGTAATPAVIAISDGATYDYGVVPTGLAVDKSFTLSNSGEMAATTLGAGGLAAPFNFKGGTYPGIGGDCATSLNGSDSCTIVVTFTPASTGSPSDTILVSYNDGAVTQSPSRDIQGVGADPALLTISDGATFNYGTVVTGSTNDKTFTLSNTGGVPATSIAGTGLAAPYAIKGGTWPGTGGDCGTSLGTSSSCTFVVTFSPGTQATHNDQVDVNYNNGVTSTSVPRPLTGVAVAPASLDISDGPTYDYGPTYTSETKDYSFTVTNNGGFASSSMGGSGLAAPFQFKDGTYPGTGGNCGTSLSVSANCTIVVTYAPTTAGLDADIVVVDYYNGAITTDSQRNLTGTGQSPIVPGVPGTPTIAITAGDQLDLTWTAPATGTAPLTYDVYRSTTSGSGFVAVQTGLIVLNWQDTGVTAGTEYFYIIRVNGPGGSTDSLEGSGTPLADFTITSATAGDQLVDIVFDSSAGAASYTVKYGTATGDYPSISSAAATSPHQVTGLTAGTQYFFMVTAVNSTGSLDATLEADAIPFAIAQKLVKGMRSRGTCSVLSNGMLKCWGQASFGMIGNGADAIRGDSTEDTGDNATLTELGTGRTASVIANSAAGYHSCAILDDNTLKCWGRNNYGQLGYGDTDNKGDSSASIGDNLATIDLGTGRTATKVATGLWHTCAVLDNGWVKCWGRNNRGQLGLEITATKGDEANEMGDFLSPVNLGTGRTAVDIAAGDEFSCAILDTGDVKCWGRNGSGQLGIGNTTQKGDGAGEMGDSLPTVNLGAGRTATKIEAGYLFVCALLDNNGVKCWGEGNTGQLGQNGNGDIGKNAASMTSLTEIDLGTGRTATDIAVGYDHACAVLDDSTLKCWGQGANGALGGGNQTDLGNNGGEMGDALPIVNVGTGRTVTEVSAGFRSTCAKLDNNTTKCWGLNTYGQTGNMDENLGNVGDGGGEMGDPLIPIQAGTGRTITQSDNGREISCHIRDDGKVMCYGHNVYSMLGIGEAAHVGDEAGEMGQNLAAVNLGTGLTANEVAMGFQHTCVLLNTGQVKCWGRNNYGQLGYEDTTNRGTSLSDMGDTLAVVDLGTGRTATDIAAGHQHTCAVLDNGQVKCWGRNNDGQLGQGNTQTRGDGASEMGDNLGAVDLGTGRTAKSITAGTYYTCAILDNDSVKCWGRAQRGQIGAGTNQDQGDGSGEMGDNLTPVDLGTGRTAKQITAGNEHTCVIMDNDNVKCWGEGSQGRLGVGAAADLGDGGGEMGDSLPTVDLGTGRTAKSISAGLQHTCAILDDDTVKCWGDGANGRTGLGAQTDIGDGGGEMGDNLSAIDLGTGLTAKALNANYDSTCVITSDDKVRCFGYNFFGTLGRGDNINIGDGGGEMGSGLNTADVW